MFAKYCEKNLRKILKGKKVIAWKNIEKSDQFK